ncbi:MAG: carbohydrate kinase [Bacteroidia bacterium]|nr:MAG: carbohydrate kinase [Bacteroidia bacterium]
MKEKVIGIFDVGKTNKKLLLFDYDFNLVLEQEIRIPEKRDDDGFECDNIELIEKWITESILKLVHSDKYDLTALNFATYGATIVYLDANGQRIGPAYNYLKPIDERIPERLYRRYGGQDEFCRRTASPALGMLNSGIQILWLRSAKPEMFSKVHYILHLPQYLSYLISGKICSEHTSIGCHTGLWDFDNMKYHSWVTDHGLDLPEPVPVGTFTEVVIDGKKINTGIGIHDSSSSLAPYFTGNRGNFLLISTGTWCINMNPFNNEKLSVEQLDNDCLCYMSVTRQPVKSSRLFLGNMHETGVRMLNEHFRTTENFYKNVKYDQDLINVLRSRYSGDRRAFFKSGPGSREFRERIDLFDFISFDESYHQLMSELTDLTYETIRLILPDKDDIENLYITGGFGKNKIFLKLLSKAFPSKKVYTSVIGNATALGAALVIYKSLSDKLPEPNLGLTEYIA